jgi:hypothetical protein
LCSVRLLEQKLTCSTLTHYYDSEPTSMFFTLYTLHANHSALAPWCCVLNWEPANIIFIESMLSITFTDVFGNLKDVEIYPEISST